MSTKKGQPLDVVLDEVVHCDYRCVEQQLRNYAAKYATPGDPGTGSSSGGGVRNVGLGADKPDLDNRP